MDEVNWSLIDKIVFINLESRPDRLIEITAELKKVKAPADKVIHLNAIKEKNGAVGCAKSHIAALEMARDNGWNNVLILEDDMVFENDSQSCTRLNNFLDKLVTISWDVVFLSASYYIIKKMTEGFYRVEWAYMANSYLVNQHYYGKLINTFSGAIYRMQNIEANAGIDASWIKLMEKDNWYGVYPCVGYQRPGQSDIEKKIIDRRDHFKRPIDDIKRFGSY